MNQRRYLTADEAADELDVSKNTLYAYVSRGLIRSEATAGSRRAKRYRAEDVRRLKKKRKQQRDPSEAARSALDFGMPVMESALTLITGGRFFYRGRDACRLAKTRPLRDVAALLWLGDLDAEWPDAQPRSVPNAVARSEWRDAAPVVRFQSVLPQVGARDERAFRFSRPAVAQTGVRLLRLAQYAIAPDASDGQTLEFAHALRTHWQIDDEAERLLRAALVLCADHELNVTAMAARCAASAEASLYGAVGAGLAALRGRRHGGGMARIETLLREAEAPDALRRTMAARMRRGDAIPGFGHRLYRETGDPRAKLLFELLRETCPDARGTAFAQAAAEVGSSLLDQAPRLDFALVALRRALGLPDTAPLALFAAGRTVGWVGHALEQYDADRPIRPRATYTGPRPGDR
jgi:citrate synthase